MRFIDLSHLFPKAFISMYEKLQMPYIYDIAL